ncbi:Pectinesterase inhibitor domain containing protein expressed [Zea mays]|jgi:pectinesterase inhibitor-like protein|uniref:Pectinesterase inhibitor domain containing protein expressed n=1 Tax=Zea mays TaxID=4577 RepID=K7U412_MAIZE|nr:Pectinesterase inhibitor domain containing protein expressed [Zea mays]|eukprot:XP_008671664.1 uncharacterized protein LOC103649099 [Zea mays]
MATTGTCMGSIIPPLVLLMTVFSAAPRVSGEPPSVVPSACKAATAAGGGTFTEDFCLSALDGKSAGAADYADMALVAVDLATANATATEAKIDALLGSSSGSGAASSEGLRSCRALYGAVVRQYQPECRAAVAGGRYGDAEACLGRTAQAAAACERWFVQRKVASPVAPEDDALAKLADLAIALASVA